MHEYMTLHAHSKDLSVFEDLKLSLQKAKTLHPLRVKMPDQICT